MKDCFEKGTMHSGDECAITIRFELHHFGYANDNYCITYAEECNPNDGYV